VPECPTDTARAGASHNIRVHVLTCVLALQIAHLMRLQAERAAQDKPIQIFQLNRHPPPVRS
jgi:hypothetical protein